MKNNPLLIFPASIHVKESPIAGGIFRSYFDATSMCDEEPIQIIGIEWNFQTRAER